MMLIVTPIFGGVEDPAVGDEMPDLDFANAKRATQEIQKRRKPHGELVLADNFDVKVEDDAMEGMSQPRHSA